MSKRQTIDDRTTAFVNECTRANPHLFESGESNQDIVEVYTHFMRNAPRYLTPLNDELAGHVIWNAFGIGYGAVQHLMLACHPNIALQLLEALPEFLTRQVPKLCTDCDGKLAIAIDMLGDMDNGMFGYAVTDEHPAHRDLTRMALEDAIWRSGSAVAGTSAMHAIYELMPVDQRQRPDNFVEYATTLLNRAAADIQLHPVVRSQAVDILKGRHPGFST